MNSMDKIAKKITKYNFVLEKIQKELYISY